MLLLSKRAQLESAQIFYSINDIYTKEFIFLELNETEKWRK
jgi:hypothetical protein